jgi:hypothetical protein
MQPPGACGEQHLVCAGFELFPRSTVGGDEAAELQQRLDPSRLVTSGDARVEAEVRIALARARIYVLPQNSAPPEESPAAAPTTREFLVRCKVRRDLLVQVWQRQMGDSGRRHERERYVRR